MRGRERPCGLIWLTSSWIHIAWLLHLSPWILPIPGTQQLAHFNENMKALNLSLTEEDMQFLD